MSCRTPSACSGYALRAWINEQKRKETRTCDNANELDALLYESKQERNKVTVRAMLYWCHECQNLYAVPV